MNNRSKIAIILILLLMVSAGVFLRNEKSNINYQSFGECIQDSDCLIVQENWCGNVLAINSNKIDSWNSYNEKQHSIAESNRQTCKVNTQENMNSDNYIAKCVENKCQARFKYKDE